MAYILNVWLDKRYSRSQFDMGLDPQLKYFNSTELEHRQQLTNYAANDCLSLHQLLLKLIYFHNEPLSDDEEPVPIQATSINIISVLALPVQTQALSTEEQRKIHNRSCTLKQRKRSYKHEIICRNSDWRFSITNIKNILRQHHIRFTLINTTKSSSNTRTLFTGIKNSELLSKYTEQIRKLFSIANYHQFYNN